MTGAGSGAGDNGRRVFLGWDRPLLASAASWLYERAERQQGLELASLERWLVVVPGRRAGRLLLDRLAGAGGGALVPPTIVNLGTVPDLVLEERANLAGELESLVVRVEVLKSAGREQLGEVFPDPPPINDLDAWLELALELERLQEELGAELLTVADVARRLAGADAGDFEVPVSEATRWRALASLQGEVERRLSERGRGTRQQALRELMVSGGTLGRLGGPWSHLLLVGVVDLPGLFRALLSRLPLEQTVLVAAPETEVEQFDDWGCPITEVWFGRELDYGNADLVVAERPVSQAASAAARVRKWIDGNTIEPEHVAVVAGSAASLELVADAFQRAGLETHQPTGRRLGISEPLLLLQRLARYRAAASAQTLSDLVRLPVLERYLDRTLECSEADSGVVAAWLEALDLELAQQPRAGSGASGSGVVAEVERILESLLSSSEQWWTAVAGVLESVYGDRLLDPREGADAEAIEALTAIAEVLDEVSRLQGMSGSWTVAEGIAFLSAVLAERRSPSDAAPGGTVELLGWLDSALDEAPCVLVLDLNEGTLPASATTDCFLPDGLRQRLALMTDRRRLARDRLLLHQLLASRSRVVLMTLRRNGEGQPQRPSRLLLACRGAELAATVERIVVAEPETADETLWRSAARSRFEVARPDRHGSEVDRLPATAFRDYLACPYRFYLKWILRLQPPPAVTRELAADVFGRLAHEILHRFALSELSDSTDAAAIERNLLDLVRVEATSLGDARELAAVAFQLTQLERRLRVFASWQAGQRNDGWRILRSWVERRVEAALDVDGRPLLVTGRIDRLDLHPELGHRIVDYKTSERPLSPQQTHGGPTPRNRERPWADLQLPLYAFLVGHVAASSGELPETPPLLAYYALSKKLEAEPLLLAPWTEPELDSALERTRDVVRQVRAQVFWPPSKPPAWDDGYSGIAGDRFPSRYLVGADEQPGHQS